MSHLSYVLLVLGLLLIFLEFFLPGGILAILATVLLILSIAFFAMSVKVGWLVFLYIVGVILLVGLLTYFTLRYMRKGTMKGMFLHSAQEGHVAVEFDKKLIGKKGFAVTDLRPAGHILIEGVRYPAVSKTGYLEKDTPVEVVSGEGGHFIVKAHTSSHT